ncbi:MAG: hypothetical protein AB2A00_22360 [Myxococcota bacterium]
MTRIFLARLLASTGLLAAACGPSSSDGGTGSTSSSGGPVVTTFTDFYRHQTRDACAYEERCAELRGRRHASRAACEARAEQFVPFGLSGSAEELAGLHFTLDSAAATRCLDTLLNLPCDLPNGDPVPWDLAACAPAFVPKPSAADVGEVCDPSAFMCKVGTRCMAPAGSQCHHCAEPPPDGTTCSHDSECGSAYCNLAEGVCRPFPAYRRGEACTSNHCIGNLICVGEEGARTCQDQVGEGQPCGEGHSACLIGFSCVLPDEGDQGTCQALLEDGATCERGRRGRQCRSHCVFPSATAATGTCQTLTAWPGAGEPCTNALGCAEETFADARRDPTTGMVTACECRTPVPLGGTCGVAGACAAGLCEHPTRCAHGRCAPTTNVEGTCVPLNANGDGCSSSSECDSGYCDRGQMDQPGVCAPAPVCE